jgi:methionyl aminopeptidase
MINMGTPDFYVDEENGWTVHTADGMPSAQWEVTVAVTESGYEILTR